MTAQEPKQAWTEEKLIARAEGIGAHWVDKPVDAYKLSRQILKYMREMKDDLAFALRAVEEERDMYKDQAGGLEDNGRLIAWELQQAKVERDQLRADLAAAREWERVEDDYWGYFNVERNGRVVTICTDVEFERDKGYIVVPLPESVFIGRRTQAQEGSSDGQSE